MGWAMGVTRRATERLEVEGVRLRYQTRDHRVAATRRVSFDVSKADRFIDPEISAGVPGVARRLVSPVPAIATGLVMESVVFRIVEGPTIRRRGMQR
jgi:hypothetical protein